jgi:SAM-dependent methyltransferase
MGYENLLGIDRFIPRSIDTENGVKVLKGGLQDLVGTAWDVIMFHHSFEHMSDPAGVLQLAASLLVPGGHCLIRIPVVGWAFQHYGVNWVQLDAPRHLFLHTEKSLRMLTEAVGLHTQYVGYDSNEFQFWASELFARDVTLESAGMRPPRSVFSKSTLRNFRSRAVELNAERRGDSAVFDLVKWPDQLASF